MTTKKLWAPIMAFFIACIACAGSGNNLQATVAAQDTQLAALSENAPVSGSSTSPTSPPGQNTSPASTESPTAAGAISIGLWQLQRNPEVSGGVREYYALFWLIAPSKYVRARAGHDLGIICPDQLTQMGATWVPDGVRPYVVSRAGVSYAVEMLPRTMGNASIPACAADPSDPELFYLLPRIPISGWNEYLAAHFGMPYQDEPSQLVLPKLGAKLDLPHLASQAPFSTSVPSPDTSGLTPFGVKVKANEALTVSVNSIATEASIASRSGGPNYALAVVDMIIENWDTTTSFKLALDAQLSGSNGAIWPRAETAYLLNTDVAMQVCPSIQNGGTYEIAANRATPIRSCFLFPEGGSRPQWSSNAMAITPDQFVFVIQIDNKPIAFTGQSRQVIGAQPGTATSVAATVNAVNTAVQATLGALTQTANGTPAAAGTATKQSDIPIIKGVNTMLVLTAQLVSYQTQINIATVVSFYKDAMPNNGWTQDTNTPVETPTAVVLQYTKGQRTASVTIGTDASSGQTLVTIVIQ